MHERNHNIDYLKLILIFFVVIGHTNTPFTHAIFGFHMPMFFFISGFFMKEGHSWQVRISKDCLRLLLPFVIFSLFGVLVEIIKRYALGREFGDFYQFLCEVFIFISSDVKYYGFVLWFLPALFWGKFISQIIINQGFWFITLSLFFITIILVEIDIVELSFIPFAMPQGIVATFFILFGYVFSCLTRQKKRLLAIAGFLYAIFMTNYYPYFDIGMLTVPKSIYALLWPVFLSFLIVGAIPQCPDSKFREWLIFSSISLFALHPYTNNAAHFLVNKYFFGGWVVNTILSVVFLCPLVFLRINLSRFKCLKYV